MRVGKYMLSQILGVLLGICFLAYPGLADYTLEILLNDEMDSSMKLLPIDNATQLQGTVQLVSVKKEQHKIIKIEYERQSLKVNFSEDSEINGNYISKEVVSGQELNIIFNDRYEFVITDYEPSTFKGIKPEYNIVIYYISPDQKTLTKRIKLESYTPELPAPRVVVSDFSPNLIPSAFEAGQQFVDVAVSLPDEGGKSWEYACEFDPQHLLVKIGAGSNDEAIIAKNQYESFWNNKQEGYPQIKLAVALQPGMGVEGTTQELKVLIRPRGAEQPLIIEPILFEVPSTPRVVVSASSPVSIWVILFVIGIVVLVLAIFWGRGYQHFSLQPLWVRFLRLTGRSPRERRDQHQSRTPYELTRGLGNQLGARTDGSNKSGDLSDRDLQLLEFVFAHRFHRTGEISELLTQEIERATSEQPSGRQDAESEAEVAKKWNALQQYRAVLKKLETPSFHKEELEEFMEWVSVALEEGFVYLEEREREACQEIRSELERFSDPEYRRYLANMRFNNLLKQGRQRIEALRFDFDVYPELQKQLDKAIGRIAAHLAPQVEARTDRRIELQERKAFRKRELASWQKIIEEFWSATEELIQVFYGHEIVPNISYIDIEKAEPITEPPDREEQWTEERHQQFSGAAAQDARVRERLVDAPHKESLDRQEQQFEERSQQFVSILESLNKRQNEMHQGLDKKIDTISEYLRNEIENEIGEKIGSLRSDIGSIRIDIGELSKNYDINFEKMKQKIDELEAENNELHKKMFAEEVAQNKEIADIHEKLIKSLKPESHDEKSQIKLEEMNEQLERIRASLSELRDKIASFGDETNSFEPPLIKAKKLHSELENVQKSIKNKQLKLIVTVSLRDGEKQTMIESFSQSLIEAIPKVLDPIKFFASKIERLVIDEIVPLIDYCDNHAGADRISESILSLIRKSGLKDTSPEEGEPYNANDHERYKNESGIRHDEIAKVLRRGLDYDGKFFRKPRVSVGE